jgi:membrane protein CcdC involved in cytochrome C biogenesis
MQGMTTGRRDAGKSVLLALQIGTVVSLLGITTLTLGFMYPMERPGAHPAIVLGALVLALGIGFLISAGISYRLSKAWGLFPESNGKPADS